MDYVQLLEEVEEEATLIFITGKIDWTYETYMLFVYYKRSCYSLRNSSEFSNYSKYFFFTYIKLINQSILFWDRLNRARQTKWKTRYYDSLYIISLDKPTIKHRDITSTRIVAIFFAPSPQPPSPLDAIYHKCGPVWMIIRVL